MAPPSVIIELEAGRQYGMGHFGRCLVIAQALRGEGVLPSFRIIGEIDDPARLAPFPEAAPDAPADILLLDRYHASEAHIAALRARHPVLAAIDDHATRALPADLIINGNYYGARLDYSAYRGARILAGPDYAPVGAGFRAAAGETPLQGSILITFGLSDIAGLLAGVAPDIARAFPERRVTAIIPDRFSITETPENLAFVSPQPLAPLIGRHETIICGMGVTWQEAATARRRVIGVRLVANQDLMLAALQAEALPAIESPESGAIIAALAGGQAPDWASVFARLDGGGPQRIARAILDAAA